MLVLPGKYLKFLYSQYLVDGVGVLMFEEVDVTGFVGVVVKVPVISLVSVIKMYILNIVKQYFNNYNHFIITVLILVNR